MDTYAINAIPHWILYEDQPLGHIRFEEDSLQTALTKINEDGADVLYGVEPVGYIVKNSVCYKNDTFYLDIKMRKPIPNLLDRLFCFLPTSQLISNEYPLITRNNETLEAHRVSLGSVVVCDQIYRPEIRLLAFLSYVDGDNKLRPFMYASISTLEGPAIHRVFMQGDTWFLDTEKHEMLAAMKVSWP